MLSDDEYMLEALSLAERAWGRTSPNPMVGALIVKNGEVIGRGYHRKAGTAHAEVNAIADCSENPTGGTIYVTLEPCSTYGRTPPCTQAIINAGLTKVVIGSLDPNPAHAGRAVKIFEDAGIKVLHGIQETRCRRLNEAFFKWITTGKPFVLLKMAMTLDGRIATASGDSRWVTGEPARERVQHLRQWADAVMVGGDTVRKDTPSLNVRNVSDWEVQPRRIVVSRKLDADAAAKFMAPGVKPEVIAPSSPEQWHEELARLGGEGVSAILVEGGGELAGNMLQAGAIDKVEFHIAPKIICGRGSRPVTGGTDPLLMAEALELRDTEMNRIGNDFVISGYIKSTVF